MFLLARAEFKTIFCNFFGTSPRNLFISQILFLTIPGNLQVVPDQKKTYVEARQQLKLFCSGEYIVKPPPTTHIPKNVVVRWG